MNFVYFFDSDGKATRMYSGKPEDYEAMRQEYGSAYYLTSDKEIPLRFAKNVDGSVVYVPATAELTYQQKRQLEYPALGDQLDMIWHSMDDGITPKIEPFYSTIGAVKTKYPKE